MRAKISLIIGRSFCIGVLCVAFAGRVHAQATSDSAGVRIIRTASRATAKLLPPLAAAPIADWGGLKDNPDDEFNQRNGFLRAVGLSDGSLAVIDNTRVRVFDRTGAPAASLGRHGSGPGEFQLLSGLCRTAGDTLLAFDGGNARLTVISRTGKLVREISVSGKGHMPDASACLGDGSTLLQNAAGIVTRITADGKSITRIGAFPPEFSPEGIRTGNLLAASGDRILVADGITPDIRIYSRDGHLTSILRPADKPRAKTDDEIRQSGGFDTRAGAPRGVARGSAPARPTWPFYDALFVDPRGRIWVRQPRYDLRDYTAPELWTAFSPTGTILGRLSIPAPPYNAKAAPDSLGRPPRPQRRPVVMEFGDSTILLLRLDEEGAAHFSRYRLAGLPR